MWAVVVVGESSLNDQKWPTRVADRRVIVEQPVARDAGFVIGIGALGRLASGACARPCGGGGYAWNCIAIGEVRCCKVSGKPHLRADGSCFRGRRGRRGGCKRGRPPPPRQPPSRTPVQGRSGYAVSREGSGGLFHPGEFAMRPDLGQCFDQPVDVAVGVHG